MKKFNSNLMRDQLSRDEMRQVTGGLYQYTCGYRNDMGTICGLSKSVAMDQVATYGGYWCCDSCASNGGSASYC